jgi:hypothetical protein
LRGLPLWQEFVHFSLAVEIEPEKNRAYVALLAVSSARLVYEDAGIRRDASLRRGSQSVDHDFGSKSFKNVGA